MLTVDSLFKELQGVADKYDELFTEETNRSFIIAISEKDMNGCYSGTAGTTEELSKLLVSLLIQLSQETDFIGSLMDHNQAMVDMLNRGIDVVNELGDGEKNYTFSRFAKANEDDEVEESDLTGAIIKITNEDSPFFGEVHKVELDCGNHVHTYESGVKFYGWEYEVLDN